MEGGFVCWGAVWGRGCGGFLGEGEFGGEEGGGGVAGVCGGWGCGNWGAGVSVFIVLRSGNEG